MDQSISLIFGLGALVVGIMLLIGKGDIFMKGGDMKARQKMYDTKKMEKVYGVSLVVIGILTLIDTYAFAASDRIPHIIYLVLVVVIIVVMIWLTQTKCKKK